MKRLTIAILISGLLFTAGCAAAYDDKKLSDSTPLAQGERSPYERGISVAQPLAGLPYGAGIVAVPIVGTAIGWLLSWRRGRRIRLAQAPSVHPITGTIGKTTGIEGLIQHLADLRAGLFEVGPEGSGLKRSWKMALIGTLATSIAPSLIPLVHGVATQITANPPEWLNGVPLVLAISGLGYLEKQLSKVLPLVNSSNETGNVSTTVKVVTT